MGAQLGRGVLVRLLAAMRVGEMELKGLKDEAGLQEQLFREACTLLASNRVGYWGESSVTFSRGDKMKAAILLCKLGEPLEIVSRTLSWSEFEDMVSTLLESVGYDVKTRLRLREPRCEIDVVAAKEDLALVIDCKHWRKVLGLSTLRTVVEDQIYRTKALASSGLNHIRRCDKFLPIILTLYSERFTVVNGVPIVPINLLSSFVTEVRGYLSELYVINLANEPTRVREG